MTSGYENRRFSRSNVNIPVTLTFVKDGVKTGQIANVSLIGIYVVANEPAALGSECEAAFAADPLKPVALRGCVVHKDTDGMGIEIQGIESGSFEALRSMIVEGAEDGFECEAEMIRNMAYMPELY